MVAGSEYAYAVSLLWPERPPAPAAIGFLPDFQHVGWACAAALLVMRLVEWPVIVGEAEERRAPHRVAAYLIDLARDFHGFYHRCRVVGEAPAVEAFRLDLCRATGATIRTGLGLLGVEAPERM